MVFHHFVGIYVFLMVFMYFGSYFRCYFMYYGANLCILGVWYNEVYYGLIIVLVNSWHFLFNQGIK